MPLTLVIPAEKLWDEENEQFVDGEEVTLVMEHSLISLSKWESKWHKRFLGDEKKTPEDTISYFKEMVLEGELTDEVLHRFTDEHFRALSSYIDDPMTATTFSKMAATRPSREQISNELIYYWMLTMGIDKECETWHLARLITLIKVTSEKNKPEKSRSKAEIMADNKALNAQRKAQYNTKG